MLNPRFATWSDANTEEAFSWSWPVGVWSDFFHPQWSTAWHRPPATYIDYNTLVCNISADLYTGVGDVTLGATLRDPAGSQNQPGPPFTLYDPTRAPTVVDEGRATYQPGFLDVAYGIVDVASNVTLTGENFAPTPRLGCEFYPSSDAAVAGDEPLFATNGLFVSATRVTCELPPGVASQMVSVHVNLNELPRGLGRGQIQPGPSAALLVYFDQRIPAHVNGARGEASGGVSGTAMLHAYLSIDATSVFIIDGANYAPTGIDRLRCLYTPITATDGQAEREAMMLGAPKPSEALTPPDPGNEIGGSVAVAATYVSANIVRCPLSPGLTPVVGDTRIRIAHSSEGNWTWSHTAVLVALYAPPSSNSPWPLSPLCTSRGLFVVQSPWLLPSAE